VGLKLFAVALAASGAFAQTLPDGPGKDVVEAVCSVCHAPTRAATQHLTKAQWQAKVTEMLQEETDVTDSDQQTIVNYLTRNFPPVKVNVNKAAAKDLEAGLELTAKESEAIVQYRAANGSFKTLDDLKKVPGLDAVKIESKKDRLEF
jgi:competence protein ComEA